MKKGVIITCLSALCFGLASIFGKLSYGGGNTAVSMTCYRALVTFVILWFLLYLKKKTFFIEKRYRKNILILGIFGQTLTTILINMSYYYIPAGTALTLHFLYPAIVAAGCILFFKEKISILKLCVIVAAFSGTLFFFEGLVSGGSMGILFALVSSVTWAFYIIYMEKTNLTKLDPFVLAFYQCGIMAVCCFIWGNAVGEMRYDVTVSGWVFTFISGVLFYIAMVCLQIGVQLLGAATASILGVFEPLSSLFLGVLILQEVVTKNQICGTVIIMIAVVVLMLEDKRSNGIV